MKFKSIKLTNFMRYKGENKIEFSCDSEKNVTVILGNNTYGKTTIAQAFRWGLYEEINNTAYVKSKDVVLLNNEVIENMDANTHQKVEVTIEVIDDCKTYEFTRNVLFRRKMPSFNIEQIGNSRLIMREICNGIASEPIEDNILGKGVESNPVQNKINTMFPKDLSNYFLFDGERWNDSKNKSSDIKDAINMIMGITPLIKMKEHLNEYGGAGGRNAVIKRLMGYIKGSSGAYDSIKSKIEDNEDRIKKYEDIIKNEKENEDLYKHKLDEYNSILEANPQVENNLKLYKQSEKMIALCEKHLDDYYADIIKKFSESYKLFAAPLFNVIDNMESLKNLEGKDIPGVDINTIKYLLHSGKCLCGTDLSKDSQAFKTLVELEKVIPPSMIGGLVGKIQDTLISWNKDGTQIISSIKDKADAYDTEKGSLEEEEKEKMRLEKLIDGSDRIASIRKEAGNKRRQLVECQETIRKSELNIIDYKKKLEELNEELKKAMKNDKQNEIVLTAISYAEKLYKETVKVARENEEPILSQLNCLIKKNFEEMFQEKDKYAQLGADYKMHLFYRSTNGFEENVLSEGEAIAANFVFIVSILELAKQKHEEDMRHLEDTVLNLPLVLDAPFSKLSTENTKLIAKNLPNFAEQVIIFMLDKDWEPSGLSKYADKQYCYRVKKDSDSNYSSITN